MPAELTPHATARIGRWLIALAVDDTAPPWNPTLPGSTPESLRRAARWLIDRGHAPDLELEMVCVLLALFVVRLPGGGPSALSGSAGASPRRSLTARGPIRRPCRRG